ncbi:LruC domain-containing protein [Vibrio sp. T11.5]|uniref:LruC domain-containing protein n=1 Tax=Vibrio sp. T11.5 TaxID=2998836 RepID=UPI0022CD5121|nr:LruC domain-containing protein [Vibrio sp. T11.5]MDA0120933.1 LruC domain-containing protein [Vibrio sp. T11.5]
MKISYFVFTISLFTTSTYATDYYYLTGAPDIGYSAKGKPDAVVNINNTLPQNLLDRIDTMLPPGQRVDPSYIATDAKSNIEIDPNFVGTANVSFTFLNEGASFNNVFGYFIFDTDNPPTDRSQISQHIVVFPNASKAPEGEMTQGDQLTYQIPLEAGQSMGFFVVPNGWGWDWLGNQGYVPYDGPWRQPFYSLSQLNPENNVNDRYHNVVFADETSELLVIGFEDTLFTLGDKDFNDLLFSVHVTPFEALNGLEQSSSTQSGYVALVGSDEPQSENYTTSYYPSASTNATLAFEDLWPHTGDFDYNDVIIRYQMTLTSTDSNQLKGFEVNATIQAMGAGFHNALAWRIPGIGSENIESISLTLNDQAVSHQITQMDGEDGVFVLSEDLRHDVIEGCFFFRTHTDCSEEERTHYRLSVTLAEPVESTVTGAAPFDPFIYASEGTHHGALGALITPGRSWELHLKNHCGTSAFDSSLLNWADDFSTATTCYVDQNNIPWAINIADDWAHPAEHQSITNVYPMIYQWVGSNGQEASDWYHRSNAETSLLYE